MNYANDIFIAAKDCAINLLCGSSRSHLPIPTALKVLQIRVKEVCHCWIILLVLFIDILRFILSLEFIREILKLLGTKEVDIGTQTCNNV